jgi:hypothetical protein
VLHVVVVVGVVVVVASAHCLMVALSQTETFNWFNDFQKCPVVFDGLA